ncbi:MAG: hypothetical protein ACREPM_01020 [Gemmatimonadaceae bacterium]
MTHRVRPSAVRGRSSPWRSLLLTVAVGASSLGAQLPAKLSDSAFWKLVTDISEPGGMFRSDNFVSNELTYQWVIPDLLRATKPGGVYLGVGPDQNFTYIVALKPKMAIIFDIRRQNMLTHLMYKALIEQSADRADFLSRLFARPRPAGLDSTSAPETMFAAFATVPPDSARFRRTITTMRDWLTKTHGFALSQEDLNTIAFVYEAFVSYGPNINYNSGQRNGFARGQMPSYAVLQVATDSDRVHRSYMATEANFRALKALESNNLLVPVVGDFAGSKAIRAVGQYLKDKNATVVAFYLSNVEQYLFNQGDDAKNFFENVASLPLDSSSTFIRSVFNFMTPYPRSMPIGPYMRGQQMLASMLEQVTLFKQGKLGSYLDVIQSSR